MVLRAGAAGAGAGAAAAAYALVGGLPGRLYAAGIALAALLVAVRIPVGRRSSEPEPAPERQPAAPPAPRPRRWRRKSRIIAELELELARKSAELDEHRRALANLGARLAREAEAAHATQTRLESRIRELEAERDNLQALVSQERERFELTLEELGGGIGQHGDEIAALERELAALIAR